jgi:hypothetical protein
MGEPVVRVWVAVTNHRKFVIQADTREQAAEQFQEKMGYYPKDWQLELMERSDDPLPFAVELNQ